MSLQVTTLKDLGAPHQFLYQRFPNWKDDRKTYMIPPVFTPKTIQLALKGPIHYTDRGELGESVVYKRLEELGKAKKIGMFVVHGFHLRNVVKWNEKCTPDYQVPSVHSGTTNEFDFIIFHHALGVIAIEVKNEERNPKIASAKRQLKTSHDFIQEFANPDKKEETKKEETKKKETKKEETEKEETKKEETKKEETKKEETEKEETKKEETEKEETKKEETKKKETKKEETMKEETKKEETEKKETKKEETEKKETKKEETEKKETEKEETKKEETKKKETEKEETEKEETKKEETKKEETKKEETKKKETKKKETKKEETEKEETEKEETKKEETEILPHKKVLALPSIKKLTFDRKNFKSLQDDTETLLLFEEDLENLESFEQWWRETFERTTVNKMAAQTEMAYEQALSYTLMVRHLGPVTDSDYIADLSLTLDNFRHLEEGFRSYPRVLEKQFPNFWSWCWDVLDKMDTGFDFGDEAVGPALKAAFLKKHGLNSKKLESDKGIKLLDNILKHSKYVWGEASVLDAMLAGGFAKKYLLFVKNTVVFFSAIRQLRPVMTQWKATDQSTKLERFPFLKMASVEDYNKLDRHLSRFKFLEGNEPTELDKELFESLTCELRVKYSQLPIVMTTEQLAVFEGPMKQVIIGAPGSGKTELLKFKALELESEMKACGITKKILYILGNGSPDPKRRPFLSYQIKRFFRKSTLVEVMTILLEEENPELLKEAEAKLREMMASGKYGHVFIDEYWIGSKPHEQEIILELVARIPGYVWISSVFDYDQSTKKYEVRTKPLIDAVEKEGGVVSRITQVQRATNTIINLERDYSAFYQGRSHPYGTKEILGHSLEGLPITWATADSVDGMYNECLEFVSSSLNDPITQTSILKTKKLVLNPADILIVNFAVRTMESLSVTPSLEARLKSAKIPFWSFGESPELFMNCDEGKVTLLNSPTREDSTHLDGVEWPVVVVILPSGVLLNTAELAPNAERLRNYDTYISCFRTQVKLVVISDKWTDEKMFLNDIKLKLK